MTRKQKSKADQWMDDISKDHHIDGQPGFIGVEIIGRIVLRNDSDHIYIEEILDKIREIGAAEVVRQVRL